MSSLPKVLLVDDRPENLVALERVLEDVHCQFVRANSGKEAVFLAMEEDFALMLMDVQMPEMDGFETVEFIRKEERNRDTPIIFISAIYRDEVFKVKGVRAGGIDFITKPFNDEIVVGKVRLFLQLHAQNEKIQQQMEALDQAHAYLQEVIDTLPAQVYGLDEQAVVQYCNRAAADFCRLQMEQACGQEIFALLPLPLQRQAVLKAMAEQRLFAEGGISKKKDKGWAIFDLALHPLRANSGSGGVLVIADVSQEHSLQERLRQSEKMEAIGTLAGGIAHDFNNILSAILGYAELAQLRQDDGERLAHDLDEIKNGACRARDLVAQILTFSRKTEQQRRPLQASLIINEALKLLRSSIPASIDFRTEINSQGQVLAEPTQLHQVIMNLCTNAAHAMAGQVGTLGVSLQEVEVAENDPVLGAELQQGCYLQIEVSDTGCGMAKSVLERIFDPFFTTKEAGKGTGLGLAVVHGIIQDHGGHITVYSELGQGSTFHIYLPMVSEENNEKEKATPEAIITNGQEQILFVDDEKGITDLARHVFQVYGYRISTFNDPYEALHHFEHDPGSFDLLITDMTMPRMTGDKLVAKVRIIRPELPVILCTGYSEVINRDKALAMGVNTFIQKPVLMSKLLLASQQLLSKEKP